jgi:hypothetical protein
LDLELQPWRQIKLSNQNFWYWPSHESYKIERKEIPHHILKWQEWEQ